MKWKREKKGEKAEDVAYRPGETLWVWYFFSPSSLHSLLCCVVGSTRGFVFSLRRGLCGAWSCWGQLKQTKKPNRETAQRRGCFLFFLHRSINVDFALSSPRGFNGYHVTTTPTTLSKASRNCCQEPYRWISAFYLLPVVIGCTSCLGRKLRGWGPDCACF